jgi:hypothetical protein
MTELAFLLTLALSTNKRFSVCERVARDALTLLQQVTERASVKNGNVSLVFTG